MELFGFGKDLHIDVGGNEIDEEKEYLWLDRGIIGQIGNVPTTDLLPNIRLPLTTNNLPRLVKLLKVALKHNFYSSLLVLAGGLMSLHYSRMVSEFSGCPIVVALGEAETGKSTAINNRTDTYNFIRESDHFVTICHGIWGREGHRF